jgi:hypothetical protein
MCQFWGGSWVENHQAEMKSTGGKFFAAQKFRVANTHSHALAALKTALQRIFPSHRWQWVQAGLIAAHIVGKSHFDSFGRNNFDCVVPLCLND